MLGASELLCYLNVNIRILCVGQDQLGHQRALNEREVPFLESGRPTSAREAGRRGGVY